MKFIITENKLERAAIHWMNQNFSPDQLTVLKTNKYPTSIFFKKNGKIVMEQDKEDKYFYFHYDDIWSFFVKFFGLSNMETRAILTKWLEETLKLEGYRPQSSNIHNFYRLEETFKMKSHHPL